MIGLDLIARDDDRARDRHVATLAREGQPAVALEQMEAARSVSVEATERRLAVRG